MYKKHQLKCLTYKYKPFPDSKQKSIILKCESNAAPVKSDNIYKTEELIVK